MRCLLRLSFGWCLVAKRFVAKRGSYGAHQRQHRPAAGTRMIHALLSGQAIFTCRCATMIRVQQQYLLYTGTLYQYTTVLPGI